MGLFDKMFTQNRVEETFSPAEAFAAITLSAVAADGYLSDEEAQGLSFVLSRMKMFKSYPNDVMRRMFDKLIGIQRRDGAMALFQAAQASLPHELRETAFAVATDLVLADGLVTQEEENFLNQLYQALEISGDTAMQIVQVMMIKNRG